ncbi:hypothetical protein ACO2Q3_20615 [Caulobacter sp. KR2-114]|uniref:hypothetical protein n=1 Tax=Caulobacter sp. KR2-114 TaxID=3400912 RepID=UPI003BFBE319
MTEQDRLIAWLDGEMPSDEAEAFAAKVAADPALAAEAERQRALGARLNAGFAPLMEAPAPAWLGEVIAAARPSAEVVDLTDRRAARRRDAKARAISWSALRWPAGVAVAAAVVLAIGVGVSLRPASPALIAPGAGGGLQAHAGLAHALDQQLASTAQAGPIRIGLTFRAHTGRVCRTFEAHGASATLAGVACRAPGGWAIAEVSAVTPDRGQYRMAGEAPAQIAAVDSLLAEGPYDAATEAKLAKAGWR